MGLNETEAEAVARLDVMLAVTACEQSVSEAFTQEDYNRDRASLEAALDAYRDAVRASADAEIADLREYLGRQNDAANDAMEKGVKVRLALGLSPTCDIDTLIAEAKRLKATEGEW